MMQLFARVAPLRLTLSLVVLLWAAGEKPGHPSRRRNRSLVIAFFPRAPVAGAIRCRFQARSR